jgi:hypothetical protein
MTEHDWVIIGFFLMSIWWIALIKFHKEAKKKCLFMALGSFLLGLFGLLLSAYRLWVA